MPQRTSPEPQARPHTGRRRNDQARQAILDTTRRLLRSHPYREVTVEAIVREAQVGKQTIYRWWPSRAAIIHEALTDDARHLVPAPDASQSVRVQLQTFLGATVAGITGAERDPGAGPALQASMAEAQADAESRARFRDGFTLARRTELRQLLQRAAEAGALASGAHLDLLVDMAYGAIWYRLLLGHAPLDARFATRLADAVLLAAGAASADMIT